MKTINLSAVFTNGTEGVSTFIGSVIIKIKEANEKKQIESKLEVQTYIDRLRYAIQSGSATSIFRRPAG